MTEKQAAVKLRTAAMEFARWEPSRDTTDPIGLKANRKLLRAALVYSETKSKTLERQNGDKD